MTQIVSTIPLVVMVFVVVSVIIAVPVMLLWNWLMPALFGVVEITFLQAWGLYILCSVLLKQPTSSK